MADRCLLYVEGLSSGADGVLAKIDDALAKFYELVGAN